MPNVPPVGPSIAGPLPSAKAANVAVRKGDDEALQKAGLTEEQIDELKTPDFVGFARFAEFQLTNNGAETRRTQQRIEDLQKRAEQVSSDSQAQALAVAPTSRRADHRVDRFQQFTGQAANAGTLAFARASDIQCIDSVLSQPPKYARRCFR